MAAITMMMQMFQDIQEDFLGPIFAFEKLKLVYKMAVIMFHPWKTYNFPALPVLHKIVF